MKKILAITLALVLTLALCACGETNAPAGSGGTPASGTTGGSAADPGESAGASGTVYSIGICQLTNADVVRHVMVQRIVEAYENYENQKKSKDKGKKR